MLAGNESPLTVDGVAVGVTRGIAKNAACACRFIPAHDAVVRDVAPNQIAAGGEIGWALGPSRTFVEQFEFGGPIERFGKPLIENDMQ